VTRRPVRIGLTGPIGCGKSTVARWLAELGAAVIDADAVARAVTEPGERAAAAVLAEFGDAVRGPDGAIDRAALGRIVFADTERLRTLEAIVHPAVRPRLLAEVETAERNGVPVVVIEAIKLVEGGLAELCDETWLIVCDEITQRSRLTGRGNGADADQRVVAQEGIVERLGPVATRVIDTSGSPARTRAMVRAIWQELLPLEAKTTGGRRQK
jgi:dephospho-CoA kinase